jgi:hypothetical protein
MLIAGVASVVLTAAPQDSVAEKESFDPLNARNALEMFVEGRETFRFDMFARRSVRGQYAPLTRGDHGRALRRRGSGSYA